MSNRIAVLLVGFSFLSAACAQDNPGRTGEQRAMANGVELAYEIVGEGEPILFIPSVLGDSFEPLMGEAALDGYQLIKYHPRGMGHSASVPYEGVNVEMGQAQDAAALLRYLEVERAHVVGHSAGAGVAMRLAIEEPGLVHSLVLLEGGETDLSVPEWNERWEKALREAVPPPNGPDRREALELEEFEGEQLVIRAAGTADWEEYLSRWIPDAREQVLAFFSWREQQSEQPEIEDRVSQSEIESISQPVIWVWSEERNPRTTLVTYGRLTELLPHLETTEILGIGHGLHLQDPTAVAEVIGEFVADHPMQ